MSDEQRLCTVYAKKFVKGRQRKCEILGHVYGRHHARTSMALISQHATEYEIEVMINVRLTLNETGQVARQYKRSAPKTCWLYFVQEENEPNIDSGFTEPPVF